MTLRRKVTGSPVASLSVLGHAYRRLFAAVGRGVLFVLGALGAGAVVVIPLWLFASRAPGAFTTAGLTALGAGLCLAVVYRVRATVRRYGGTAVYLRKRVAPRGIITVLVLLLSVWAYWVAVLLAGGLVLRGLLAGTLWFLSLGIAAAVSHTLRRRNGQLP